MYIYNSLVGVRAYTSREPTKIESLVFRWMIGRRPRYRGSIFLPLNRGPLLPVERGREFLHACAGRSEDAPQRSDLELPVKGDGDRRAPGDLHTDVRALLSGAPVAEPLKGRYGLLTRDYG